MVLLSREARWIEFSSDLEKCGWLLDKEFSLILNLPGFVMKNTKELKKVLKEQKYNYKKIEKIISFLEKRKEKKINNFFEFLKQTEGITKEKGLLKIKKIDLMLKEAKRFSLAWNRKFASLAVALNLDNKALIYQLADELIIFNPLQLLWEENNRSIEAITPENIKLVQKILVKFKEFDDEGVRTRMLADKVFSMLGEKFRDYKREFSADWSLQEVREFSKHNRWGSKYFTFWFSKLFNRASDIEVRDFINKRIGQDLIQKAKDDQLWIFSLYLPNKDELREQIYKRFESLWRSNIPYKQHMVILALSNESFKRGLIEKVQEFKRPLFQTKRTFYKSCLERGTSVNFCLYNLVLLGDKDDHNLWWLRL
jgi:hypothetical protein